MTQVFLLLLVLVQRCWAGDVTVYMNDSAIVTVPPNLWSDIDVYTFPICGYLRFLNGTGQSVSLSFTGVLVTVNLYPYIDGSIAQLSIDGQNITRIDTYNLSGIGSSGYNCASLPWTSDPLPPARHTITVTELYPNGNISIGLVPMLSFVYRTTDNISTSMYPGPSSASTSRKLPNAGSVAGGVVGGFIALVAISTGAYLIYQRRRRQKHLRAPMLDLMGDDTGRTNVDADVDVQASQIGAGAVVAGAGPPRGVMEQLTMMSSPDTPKSFAQTSTMLPPRLPTIGQLDTPTTVTIGPFPAPTPLTKSSTPQSSSKKRAGVKQLPIISPISVTTEPPQPAQLPNSRSSPLLAGTTSNVAATTLMASTANNGTYTEPQLSLLKKLSDARADGVVITAVARGMLLASSSSADPGHVRAGDEAEEAEDERPRESALASGDLALLQRLSDSGADGEVVKDVADGMINAHRQAENTGGGMGSGSGRGGSEEDAPPGYDEFERGVGVP